MQLLQLPLVLQPSQALFTSSKQIAPLVQLAQKHAQSQQQLQVTLLLQLLRIVTATQSRV